MLPVLQAVPNFSEGRDLQRLGDLVRTIEARGVEVLDWSCDPDHNRAVVTYLGDPTSVEAASVEAARFARDHFDLRGHRGVHPRIGALDVLPLVPLEGLTLADAVASANRVGRALAADLGIPVYFYGEASNPPGRRLSSLRRGGFEALADGFPKGREPDLAAGRTGPHPSAGVTCVGARRVLLAWNLVLEGVDLDEARALASELREANGTTRDGDRRGFPGLRALALKLPSRNRLQLSMNLEDLERTAPFEVFLHVERWVTALGGRIAETEVIGMIPDPLVLPAAADRLHLLDCPPSRMLSTRLALHVSERAACHAEALLEAVREEGEAVPARVREAALRLSGSMTRPSGPNRSPRE
jgi:glutamate formiminotransferase